MVGEFALRRRAAELGVGLLIARISHIKRVTRKPEFHISNTKALTLMS